MVDRPEVVQLGPGYTKAVRIGQRTVFFDEAMKVPPKVLGADGVVRVMKQRDWLHMKAAEDKRRARRKRNLG